MQGKKSIIVDSYFIYTHTVLCTHSGIIGREIAVGLAEKGFELVLAVRDEKKGQDLVRDLKSKGHGGRPISLELVDMAKLESLHGFVSRVSSKYPRLDVLVNNAACVPQTREVSTDGFELQFVTNILSYFVLMVRIYLVQGLTG